MTLQGSGKRGRPSGDNAGKDDILLQAAEELEGCKLKLQNTNLPNVMVETLAAINAFKAAELVNPKYLQESLIGVSHEDLDKLHHASMTRNVDWKFKQLAATLFKTHFNNAMLLQTRSKLCETAFIALMKEAFTQKYWKDGQYQHAAFTEDILSIIKDKSKNEGIAEGQAAANADAEM